MADPVIIADYYPAWPEIFQELRGRVAAALGDVALSIEHIGSTAVPGLAAKPIVDMDVVVRSAQDVAAAIERLATLGYVHEGDGGVPGREAFVPPPNAPRHHLYVVIVGDPGHRNHMLFRDYLRRHPEEARVYADLKRALADRFRDDRSAYTDAKDELIGEMLKRAEEQLRGR